MVGCLRLSNVDRGFEALLVGSPVGRRDVQWVLLFFFFFFLSFYVQDGKLKTCGESKAKHSQAEPCSGSLSWEYLALEKTSGLGSFPLMIQVRAIPAVAT